MSHRLGVGALCFGPVLAMEVAAVAAVVAGRAWDVGKDIETDLGTDRRKFSPVFYSI